MMSCNKIALVVALCATLAGAARHLHLDDKYMVDVDVNATHIDLTLNVTTTGWVGFGVNVHPNMTKADLFIGGVNATANTTYFGDYHGKDANEKPDQDEGESDWKLTSGTEVNGTTILKLTRLLVARNENEDINITNSNMYVIWSYRNDDDINQMHSARGNRSLNLFSTDDSAGGGGDTGTALVSCFSTLVMGLIVSLYKN